MTRYTPTGPRHHGHPSFDDQYEYWHEAEMTEKRSAEHTIFWLALALLIGIVAAVAIAYGASRAEARPAVCTNFPHECAAAVEEAR